MKIKKISGKPFYNGNKIITVTGKTRINELDPKKREAYILDNNSVVNCILCEIINE